MRLIQKLGLSAALVVMALGLTSCAAMTGHTKAVTTLIIVPAAIKGVRLSPFVYPISFTSASHSSVAPVGGFFISQNSSVSLSARDLDALRDSLVSSLRQSRADLVVDSETTGQAKALPPGWVELDIEFTQLGLIATLDGTGYQMIGNAKINRGNDTDTNAFNIRARSIFATVNGAKKAAYEKFSRQIAAFLADNSVGN